MTGIGSYKIFALDSINLPLRRSSDAPANEFYNDRGWNNGFMHVLCERIVSYYYYYHHRGSVALATMIINRKYELK